MWWDGKNGARGFNFEFSPSILSHSHLQFSPKYTSIFPFTCCKPHPPSPPTLFFVPLQAGQQRPTGGPLLPSVDDCLDRYYADLVSAEDVQRMRVTPGLSRLWCIGDAAPPRKESGCKQGLYFGIQITTIFAAAIHVNSNLITCLTFLVRMS